MSASGYESIADKRPDYIGTFALVGIGLLVLLILLLVVTPPGAYLLQILIALVLGGGINGYVYYFTRVTKRECPYCKEDFHLFCKWQCPSCPKINTKHVFQRCEACKQRAAAFACPYCSKPILLTDTAATWDKQLVDTHTIFSADSVYKKPPASEASPASGSVPPQIDIEAILRAARESKAPGG